MQRTHQQKFSLPKITWCIYNLDNYLIASSSNCLILLVLLSRPLVLYLSKEKFRYLHCLFSIPVNGLRVPSPVETSLSSVPSPGSLLLLRPTSISGALLQLYLIRSECPFFVESLDNSDLNISGAIHLTVTFSCGSTPSISSSWILDENLIKLQTEMSQPFCHTDQLGNFLLRVSKM